MLSRILSATVDPYLDFDNPPTLCVEISEPLQIETPWEILHEDSEGTLVMQQEGPFANFLYEDKHNHDGYGGRRFELLLKDGSSRTLKGPWSSREACVNKYIPHPMDHLVDVKLIHPSGPTSGSIILQEALRFGIPLIRIPSKDEISKEEWASYLIQDGKYFDIKALVYDPDEGPHYTVYGKWRIETQNKRTRLFNSNLDHPIRQFLTGWTV